MFGLLLFLFGALIALPVKAVCPVCTVAAVAGVGLSRWLGIDDLITGVWIGGLTVSLIVWTLDWFSKKRINFKLKTASAWIAYYSLVLGSLHFTGILWHPENQFFRIDKIIFGTAVGTLVLLSAIRLHRFLKKNNGDKSYFPYQKVALPVSALLITSIIFFLMLKWT